MPELHTTKPEPKRHDFAAGETGRGPSVPSNGLANDPKAGQWDGRRMSKRMIADYKTFIVTDGEGVRNSLYVSGCPFHCVDCFNASIWDFQAGHEYTQKLEDKIIEDLKAPWVQGITRLQKPAHPRCAQVSGSRRTGHLGQAPRSRTRYPRNLFERPRSRRRPTGLVVAVLECRTQQYRWNCWEKAFP